MCRHALEDDNPDDLRLTNALVAQEELRSKLTAALIENVKLRIDLAERQAVTLTQPDPAHDAVRARLEEARDHGGWLLRRWARQMLGEIS